MTRVGIMTFLHNDNYGSILQALALQTALREMGYQAEHIDYRPSCVEKALNLLRSGNSPALVLEGMRKRGVRSYGATNALHERFLRERLTLSEPCRDHAALKRAAGRYDVMMCGSDQIWSPVWLNPAYFLDFADKPRIAYAASLGVKEMPSAAKQRRIARLAKPFAVVSVREKEGAALLERLTGTSPVVMPDPVVLRTREQWQAIAREPEQRTPYLLCYFIGNQEAYWQQVEALSRRLGVPALVVPKTAEAYQSGLALKEDAAPDDWLGLLNGAAYIITDSFHASAFACILNKPFTVLRRYREGDPENKNSRVDQLLRTLELTDTANPDWEHVNEKLAFERERGLAWLKRAIEGAL